jgi:general secretion pathway protein I
MVAIAILALSLSAIFSSEAGAIKMAHRARKMGLASLLARCKMGEIEEQVASEGLPAVFDSGSDECCEDGEIDGFSCDWEIDPIVLPDTMFPSEEGEEPGADPGSSDSSDPLAQFKDMDPQQALSGGGLDGVASMALNYAYPVLKPAFEQQIRRATVTVHWKEGSREHEFDVTQYLVSDQPIPAVDPNALPPAGQVSP